MDLRSPKSQRTQVQQWTRTIQKVRDDNSKLTKQRNRKTNYKVASSIAASWYYPKSKWHTKNIPHFISFHSIWFDFDISETPTSNLIYFKPLLLLFCFCHVFCLLVLPASHDLLIDDKKGGVDRSTTVIAKDPPEGNFSGHQFTRDTF